MIPKSFTLTLKKEKGLFLVIAVGGGVTVKTAHSTATGAILKGLDYLETEYTSKIENESITFAH